MQRGLPIIPLHIDRDTSSKKHLDNTDLSFPRCRVQQDSAVGTGSEQGHCHVHMTRSCGPVQRGLPIIPLHIDRDTDRKQDLGGTDMPFDGCHMQQGPTVGTGRKQDPRHIHMTRSCSPVQRGFPIVSLHINRNTRRKQYLRGAGVSRPSGRMQQCLTIGTGSDQKLGDISMSFPRSRMQHGPTIGTGRKQDPRHVHMT